MVAEIRVCKVRWAPSTKLTQVRGPLHAQPLASSSLPLSPPLLPSSLCLQACGLQAGGRVGSARRGPTSAACAGASSGRAVPPSSAIHRTRATWTQRCALSCACVQRQRAAAAGATPRTPGTAGGPLSLVAACSQQPLGSCSGHDGAPACCANVCTQGAPTRSDGLRPGVAVAACATDEESPADA